MSDKAQHGPRRTGKKMAVELEGFLHREFGDGAEMNEALLGAFDHFDTRTRMLRDPRPRWPEAPRQAPSSE